MTITSKRLIKYIIMGFIMVLMVDTIPRKGMSDDTVIFLNPITSSPPPAVSIFLDTSGSMTSLPCAVPDGEDACGIEQNNSNPYFKTQLGYDPNTDYGYDAGNPTCFDANINPGGDGCYYGGTSAGSSTEGALGPNQTPSGSHVYINTYFLGYYENPPSYCQPVQSKGPGGIVPPAPNYGWADCGSITYFCNHKNSTTVMKNQCINQMKGYGYWYWNNDGQGGISFYTGNLLNFYPPKFVVTRKVMSDLITYNANQYTNGNGVRFGVFSFNGSSSGAQTDVKIFPPCNQLGSNPTPGKYLNTLYSLTWDHSTPLAGAIVQVGAYFANNTSWYEGLACNNSSYCTIPSGATLGNACSSDDSWCGCYNPAVSCEKNFLIVMTDGNENAGPNGLPSWPIGSYQKSTTNESACSNAPGGSCNIDEVAGFLYNHSIRPPTQAGCTTNINTYTIGFAGTAADGTALNTYALKRAADIGGGMFANAQNWKTLETALYTFFANIVKQTKTFGTPSLPQLLTAGGGNTTTTVFKTFIASFLPQSQTFWVGHLREYTGAVDPTTGTIQVYDKTGKPFSGNTSAAGQCSFSEIIPPPIWDAGADLSDTTLTPCSSTPGAGQPPCYLAPNLRNVYTVTPSLLSGFTTNTTSNGDTTWSAGGDSVLSAAQAFTTSNTNLQPTDFDITDTTTMDNVIDYILGPKQDGVDVLGDIFHSDPTLVSADALSVDYLGSPDSAITQLDYQAYLNAVYSRPQIVVAGADDGMVHAFFTGAYTGGAQFFNGNYEPYTAQFDLGTGQEVWAFVPYDLLPKLQYMYNPAIVPTTTTTGQYWTTAGIYITANTQHVYYVDGSPFIRDVYLPNVNNGLGLSGNAAYWHTIMIIGERLGGTYYICLDITDTLHPKFMWEFTTQDMGFTFSKIAPHGSSIGPVWLDFDPASGSPTSPQLRWVVMFNGGWDPGVTTNRGRGFYVVDIATGKLIWKFDQSSSNGGSYMQYPTPASVDAIAQYTHGSGHSWWMEAFLPDLGGQLWQFSFLPRAATAGSWGGSLDPLTGLVRTCTDPKLDTNCFWGQREFAAQNPTPQQSLAQQFYFLPSSIWDPCNNLWLGLASGDDNNPLSCSPPNYFYEFVQNDPYTPVTSVLTASNLTTLTGSSGFSTPMCGIQPGYPIVGWDIALSSFSGTSTGAKSLNTSYSAYGIQYFGVFTPDPKACTGGSSQYNCQVIGGTGVVVSMAIDQLNGGQIKAGQVISVVPTGAGIPSTPLLVTTLFGGAAVPGGGGGGGGGGGNSNGPPSFGSAPILSAPLNPYTMPICNTGPGSLKASMQCLNATSGGVFTQCGTITSNNSLIYPYYRVCVPQNVENNFLNPLDTWSLHPPR